MLKKKSSKITTLKFFNLNFGPQHPSAHGVLRLVLELNGELITRAIPHIGLLHRGTEKLIELKMYKQAISYFDRLDYVSMMSQEHVFCLAIESLLNIPDLVPIRAQYIRVLLSEITRLLNHLMAITTHAMDIGALTPFLWAFEEREKLLEFYERIAGARMHAVYFRPGGVYSDIPLNLLNDISFFIQHFSSRVDEIEELLTNNKIWQVRVKNIGIITQKDALSFGFSGILIRAVGTAIDIRKTMPYEIYKNLDFIVPVGFKGDCLTRYNLRIYEMRQSISIILQCLNIMPFGLFQTENYKIGLPFISGFKQDMSTLIHHFKILSSNFNIIKNQIYVSIEAPKGEVGIFLVSNDTNKAYRCKIKAPGFLHLQGINILSKNHLLADIVAIIGTADIVFGEVDR